MISDDMRERIASAIGWSIEDTRRMSLQGLRSVVEHVSQKLAAALTNEIRSGRVILGEPRRPRRRR